MKTMMTLIVLLGGLVLASEARADPPLQLKMSVQPVVSEARLAQLMRQNSVRIALQRHRLWQAAVLHEESRDQVQERHRFRRRKRVRVPLRRATARGTVTMVPAPMVAASTPDVGMSAPRAMRPTPMTAPAPRARPRSPASWKQLLRRGRLGNADALERKLQERIRERRRQRERLRQRGGQGSSMSTRRGGRGGR